MPLSSVLGASTLIKPGVVTSSTRPSVPYEGQLIYETDTDRIAAYNGAAWVTQNGLQLIKTQTIGSAVSSVTVSDVFSSTYDNYLIQVAGGVGSTPQDIKLTLGATATGYYGFFIYGGYTGNTVSGLGQNNVTGWVFAGYSNTNNNNANIVLLGPNLAKETQITSTWTQGTAGSQSGVFNGMLNNSTQYTAFTLAVTGTMTGGTIRVYGYANS